MRFHIALALPLFPRIKPLELRALLVQREKQFLIFDTTPCETLWIRNSKAEYPFSSFFMLPFLHIIGGLLYILCSLFF